MTLAQELIAAVATPAGRGGIGVLRLSGRGAIEVAETMCGRNFAPREATFSRLKDRDGAMLDEGIVLCFPGPASFTGEDVVELQVHGAPVVLRQLLAEVCALGARVARPGEFSERAFLNGKLDLAQAEAIADLIAAGSDRAARAAVRSLQGEFSRHVTDLAEALEQLRMLVEATIDFPEEDEDFLRDYSVGEQLARQQASLHELLSLARQGQVLKEGCTVALIGEPNAGKSSLLNALTGEDVAIVTAVPGTTRDTVQADLSIGALPVRLVDTAGLRASDDVVEAIGIQRAQAQAQRVDLVLLVLDLAESAAPLAAVDRVLELAGLAADDARLVLVGNKLDLLDQAQRDHLARAFATVPAPPCWVSAHTGEGLETLRARVCRMAGLALDEPPFTARQRHVDALRLSADHLGAAADALAAGQTVELVAEDLRLAHNALGEIVGRVTPDDLLGRIFGEFCIGK